MIEEGCNPLQGGRNRGLAAEQFAKLAGAMTPAEPVSPMQSTINELMAAVTAVRNAEDRLVGRLSPVLVRQIKPEGANKAISPADPPVSEIEAQLRNLTLSLRACAAHLETAENELRI